MQNELWLLEVRVFGLGLFLSSMTFGKKEFLEHSVIQGNKLKVFQYQWEFLIYGRTVWKCYGYLVERNLQSKHNCLIHVLLWHTQFPILVTICYERNLHWVLLLLSPHYITQIQFCLKIMCWKIGHKSHLHNQNEVVWNIYKWLISSCVFKIGWNLRRSSAPKYLLKYLT